MDQGGVLWLAIDVGLVVTLAAAIAFGIMQYRRRPDDPATRQARDDATRRGYEDDGAPAGAGRAATPLAAAREISAASQMIPKAQRYDRPTEDDYQRDAFGGTRGSPDLADQKMTAQRAKKTPGLAGTPGIVPSDATDREASRQAAAGGVEVGDLK